MWHNNIDDTYLHINCKILHGFKMLFQGNFRTQTILINFTSMRGKIIMLYCGDSLPFLWKFKIFQNLNSSPLCCCKQCLTISGLNEGKLNQRHAFELYTLPYCFRKLHYKLMNPWEIGLFHIILRDLRYF